MSTTTYALRLSFDTLRFSADLAEASAPICIVVDGEARPTQYQTADARHDVQRAARLVLESCGRDYYAALGDARDNDEILDELMESATVS